MEPPLYDFRIKHVCKWHVIECHCYQCDRTAEIPHRILKRGRNAEQRLIQLERLLKCTSCGTKGSSVFRVKTQPR